MFDHGQVRGATSHRWSRVALSLLALVAVGFLSWTRAADAVLSADQVYNRGTYGPGSVTVPYYFDLSFPKGQWRSRIINGANAWNALKGSLKFKEYRVPSVTAKTSCSDIPDNSPAGYIRWGQIDGLGGEEAAETDVCVVGDPETFRPSGRLKGFIQKYDSDEDWYIRTGKPFHQTIPEEPPQARLDAWSVAAHEMGHATGYIPHLRYKDRVCHPNERLLHTMCKKVTVGRDVQRTLERWDFTPFIAKYGGVAPRRNPPRQ